ncbi:MAG: hypothetical protein AAFN41_08600 [Planctomycetota bacterium]
MDHDTREAPAKTKSIGGKLITTGCIALAVLAAGSRFYFDTFAKDATAKNPEVEALSDAIESLRDETVISLETDPEALDRFQQEHRKLLSDFRDKTSPSDSPQAFFVDFVLSYNTKAPDEDAMAAEWERIMDFSTIETPADIMERADKLRWLEEQSLAMIAWIEAFPAEFEAALALSDFSERSQRKAKKSVVAAMALPARVEIHQLDRRMYRVINDILIHLRASWGRWTYDTESGMVLFDNDADVATLNGYFDQLDTLIAKQIAIQDDLLTMHESVGR